ncbi:MAG: tRNA glutamyl-Q(34) synthetase GluQRS, partial [Pseudomonadota bacterium]
MTPSSESEVNRVSDGPETPAASGHGAPVVSRFAPSPTGWLHMGHAASVIRAHDFARARNGRFLLRIEDIDRGRTRPEYVAGILTDMAWLGLEPDDPPLMQWARADAHMAALERLIDTGLLFPCVCTRKDIAAAHGAPHPGEHIPYPGTCRDLNGQARAAALAGPHAWRLDARRAAERVGQLHFRDNGERIDVDPLKLGDAVIARKDVGPGYHLAVTVDDAFQEVTDVVRGVDLLDATHLHRVLQALLGLPVPRYHHHPLILDNEGRRLAKRDGVQSLAELRAAAK